MARRPAAAAGRRTRRGRAHPAARPVISARWTGGDQRAGRIRGIAARIDGTMVGIAHYLFHASIWYSGNCCLADLYVAENVRRKGVATALIGTTTALFSTRTSVSSP
ncbi:GNAT family N-acetyltransferase [Amycolatopsis orientalis]|uniref:GNAT family N-acetyltransferase n=1 Tax=Amycolatopsis orientalis TaxID=31958 RepID=UPI002E0EDF51